VDSISIVTPVATDKVNFIEHVFKNDEILRDGINAVQSNVRKKSEFKNGSDIFISGKSCTVNDVFITADTFITVIPTKEKAGIWSVESSDNKFIITSDSDENNISFEWNGIKGGE